ncbi:MAG: hypothetical protein ACLP7O_12015 [Terracidiphilus sp.]
MVGADVRQVESEIDDSIQKMVIWNVKRDVLLQSLMTFWRDSLEMLQMLAAHADMFQVENGLQKSIAMEHLTVTGVFQSLKWTMQYSCNDGEDEISDEILVNFVMKVAGPYQILVDALKLGLHDRAEFSVDHNDKTLTIYEGGEVSGHDFEIVSSDHITSPFHKQNALVEDSDQLTTNWTAGQYRQYWRWLRSIAENAETNTILGQAGPLAPMVEIMKQPVVVEIPPPPALLSGVQHDLTLTIEKAQGALRWKIDSWHDCPLVQIGDRVFGVSRAILTLAKLEDYMLRTAVLNDPGQYEKVSGLREERMIAICKKSFEEAGWTFTPHFLLTNPPKEIDVYATKESETCIVQLKSTLRPQSPWEVYKRNADVIEGINHTSEVLHRFDKGAMGIVITDGYEGDYATWRESLATGVAVATLDDLDLITKNQKGAFKVLAERAGIDGKPTSEGLPERSVSLCGWTIRMLDEPKP